MASSNGNQACPPGVTDGRARSLTRIYELMTELLNVEDISQLLNRIAESVRELFGFEWVSISIMDEAKGVFADHVLAGYPPEVEAEVVENAWAFVSESILADFREDCKISRISYYVPAEKQDGGMDGFVAVRDREAAQRPRPSPDSWHELDLLYFSLLDRRGQTIGYLQADYPKNGKVPSKDVIEQVELFAGVAAVGIENSKMYQRAQDLLEENEIKTQRIMNILELMRSVGRVDDPDVVLQKVSDALASTFGYRKTGVSLFSEDSDRVTVHALTGYDRAETEAIHNSVILKSTVLTDFKEEFRITETGYYVPAESQKDGAESFVFIESPHRATEPRRTPDSWHELDLLYFGLHDRNGRQIGYVQLDYPEDGRIPTKETMEAMEAFASLASVAIENSEIFKEISETREQVRMYLDLLTHDVGNFINPVNAYLEMIMTTTMLSPTQHKYVEAAMEATKNIIHLIRNVGRMAQTLEGAPSERVPMNLSRSLRQMAQDAKDAFVGRQVEIRLDLPPEDLWVMADVLLDEVFYNLLTNSIRYDEHKDVVIDVSSEPAEFETRKYVLVKVVDRAVGVPDEHKQRVFAKGFKSASKVEWPQAHKSKGAGMGLPLVKALVDKYRGKVWIENRVYGDYSKGSAFNLLLPIA